MAVQTWIYGKPEVRYKGCVINTYERNGYDDSDWYAMCWDEEKQEVVEIEYDTTRCGAGGHAEIDASLDVLRKVYRHYKKAATSTFDKTFNPAQAKLVRKGDTVLVVRGRKVPKGTTGKAFWIGTRFNRYSNREEERVGIEDAATGEKVFVPLEYVEVIGWERRLMHGKKRKKEIRQGTMKMMPYIWQRYFWDGIIKEKVV